MKVDASHSTVREQVRPLAREWVGQTFFGTLLKQARDNPLAPEDSPFSGGRGGEAFGSLFDQHMAAAAASGAGAKLVETVVDHVAGRAGGHTIDITVA